MNATVRARCLRRAYARLALALTPAPVVLWLMWKGEMTAAGLLFCAVLGTMMIGTLVPRCSLFGRMIKSLPPEENAVLLTVDDGPHPEHTPMLLNLLDRHGIKAVFFLVGERAARHPELVREIVARGHEIGNHTQTHPAGTFWMLRPKGIWREIEMCQETLAAICPEQRPRFFRPPAGHHNAFTALTARALGLKMMLWSARGFDGVMRDVPGIVQRIGRGVKAGSIVLIHEGTPVAAEVAEAVTAMLAASGLKCGTPPGSLAFRDDEVVVERSAAP